MKAWLLALFVLTPFALYTAAAGVLCVHKNNGAHRWCPCCLALRVVLKVLR